MKTLEEIYDHACLKYYSPIEENDKEVALIAMRKYAIRAVIATLIGMIIGAVVMFLILV